MLEAGTFAQRPVLLEAGAVPPSAGHRLLRKTCCTTPGANLCACTYCHATTLHRPLSKRSLPRSRFDQAAQSTSLVHMHGSHKISFCTVTVWAASKDTQKPPQDVDHPAITKDSGQPYAERTTALPELRDPCRQTLNMYVDTYIYVRRSLGLKRIRTDLNLLVAAFVRRTILALVFIT